MVSVYNRAGAAFGAGAPVGASWNVGQSTTDEREASTAGAAFGSYQAGFGGQRTRALEPASYQRAALDRSGAVGTSTVNVLNVLNTPVRWVGDYLEAKTRIAARSGAQEASFVDRFRPLASTLGVVQFLDPAFRAEFAAAQEAKSSPGQTLWLSVKGQLASDEVASRQDPFDLIDDPTRFSEREEYFASGAAHWTSAVIDMGVNLGLDPLIVGGKAVGAVRASRNAIKASDVAAVASGTMNLTRGGRRLNTFVNNIVDASEVARTTPGGYATMAANPALAQSADTGAITYAMSRLDVLTDDAVRLQAKKNVILAGMGHRPSLAALDESDRLLRLEVENLTGPNQEFARQSLLLRTDRDYIVNLREAHADDWMDEVVDAHIEAIHAEREALMRVGRVGNPAGLAGDDLARTTSVGEINALPDSVKLNAIRYNPGEVMGIGATIHKGLGLPPVHVLWGRKVSNLIPLDGDDAYQSFASAVMRTTGRAQAQSRLDDTMKGFLDEFAGTFGAADPAAARMVRRDVLDRFNHEATERIVKRYGAGDAGTEHVIRQFIREVRSRRTAEMVHVKERAQQALDLDKDVAYVVGDDGVLAFDSAEMAKAMGAGREAGILPSEAATPFAGTQGQAFAALPDYAMVEKFVRDKLADGAWGYARRKADGVVEFTDELLSSADQLWKFGALFRPGYPIRNLVDTQSRNLAMLGMVDMLGYASKGFKNLRYNMGKVPVEYVDTLARVASARARVDQIDDMLRVSVDTMGNAIEGTALQAERTRLVSLIDDGEAALIAAAKGAKSGKTVRLKDTPFARHIGMDGERPAFRDAADAARAIDTVDAADSVAALAAADANSFLGVMRSSGQWQHVAPSHPQWARGYLEMVNKRIRNDKGLLDLLAGADNATVRSWYLEAPEGRAIWKGLAARYGDDVDAFITKQREQLDRLVPTGPARSHVLGGPVTEGMIDDMFEGAARPALPAEMFDTVPKTQLERLAGRFDRTRAQWFKIAGELPEEMLGRLPFYVSRKEGHLSRLWPKLDDGTDMALTVKQTNELYSRAGVLARRDVATYLFDTSQRSNLAAHLRFFSPFYMAWSDTMRKWTRIMGYNPAALGYGSQVVTSVNSAFQVVDDEGNRIMRNGDIINAEGEVVGQSQNPFDGYIVLPIPEGVGRWMGADDQVLIAKSALNVTFQGEPFWLPSMGPLVTMPANGLATRVFPDLAESPVGKWLLPFGPEADIKSQAAPAWARNAATLMRAEMGNHGESRLAQTYAMILAAKQNEIRRGEAEPMSQGELMDYADNATRNWWIMRFASNWMGFTAQPQSKLEFYVEEYRRLRREHGSEADELFMQEYPDYYEATVSLSVNETGISATDDTWTASQRYATDIARNKQYGWMYVGAANLAPGFSEGVYTAQQARGWRSVKDPVQAYTDVQVSRGWTDYNRVADAIQQQLEQRLAGGGSGSLTSNANADLAEIRAEFLAQLKGSNPEWANEFEQGGTAASVNAFFRAAATAQEDNPELKRRSDFVALNDYLTVRAAIREQLDARGLATVESDGAEDLAELWGEYTTQLVASDIGFEQMWTRAGLDRDAIGRG